MEVSYLSDFFRNRNLQSLQSAGQIGTQEIQEAGEEGVAVEKGGQMHREHLCTSARTSRLSKAGS